MGRGAGVKSTAAAFLSLLLKDLHAKKPHPQQRRQLMGSHMVLVDIAFFSNKDSLGGWEHLEPPECRGKKNF